MISKKASFILIHVVKKKVHFAKNGKLYAMLRRIFMIRQNIVNLYAHGSKVDLMVAEKDVLLTYVLKMLENKSYFNLVFKGGTCLRKCYFGRITRFSEDLDFQATPSKEIKRNLLEIFEKKEFSDIRFSYNDDDIYDSKDSFGINITYSHDWNPGSIFKIQISFRNRCILPPIMRQVADEVYSKYLEFPLPIIPCMALDEIIAEKVRACYQRATVRDAFDLFLFSKQPFNKELIRKLVVIKMWEVHQDFDAKKFLEKVSSGEFVWYDIERLISRDKKIKPKDITNGISTRFSFLRDMSKNEEELLKDARRQKEKKKKIALEEDVKRLHKKNIV